MEEIFNKVEEKINNLFQDFEKKPVKTGIKLVVIIWVIKKVYNWLKNGKVN